MSIPSKDGTGAAFTLGAVDVGGAQHVTGVAVDPADGVAFKAASEATLALLAAALSNHDAVATDGHAGVVMLAKRRDTDASAMVADGDFGYISLDENQRVKVSSQPATYANITGNITAVQATIGTPVAGRTAGARD